MLRKRSRFLLLCILCLLITASAAATTAVLLDVKAHLKDSTAVVEARVRTARITTDAETGRPYTHTTLAVDRVLFGSAPDRIEITQMRGLKDGVQQQVVGDGVLEKGARVVVFARKWHDGRWYLSALSQSVYHVKGEGDDAPVERNLGGLKLMERHEGGGLKDVHRLNDFRTLRELRDAIEQAASEL